MNDDVDPRGPGLAMEACMAIGIKDVAALAGVSSATASRALSGRGSVSDAARERVKQAASELGFVVSYNASSLASGRSRNIGVAMPYVDRWYFSTVLAGITVPLHESGYDLTLYDFQGDRHRATVLEDFLLRKRLDGIITVGLRLSEEDVDQLRSTAVPLVSIGGHLDGIDSLAVDDRLIGRLATEHLISLGHTRIAHIGGEDEPASYFHMSRSRREGYEEAMTAAGLEWLPAWSTYTDYSLASAYADARDMLADPRSRPTAIVCASDEIGVGAMLAAQRFGIRVPHELSLIGIDGNPFAEAFGLTTIDQFAREQGARAAESLLSRLLGPTTPQSPVGSRIELPVRVVPRSSTAAPGGPSI